MTAPSKLGKFLVIALAVVSLASSVNFWHSTRSLDKGSEAIERWEFILAPVRDRLPIQRGVIGYVGEWDIVGSDNEYEDWDQMAEYLLTQYVLAPLIVKRGAVAEWNVAVLTPASMQAWQQAHEGEFRVIPLKHNVYILRKLDQ